MRITSRFSTFYTDINDRIITQYFEIDKNTEVYLVRKENLSHNTKQDGGGMYNYNIKKYTKVTLKNRMTFNKKKEMFKTEIDKYNEKKNIILMSKLTGALQKYDENTYYSIKAYIFKSILSKSKIYTYNEYSLSEFNKYDGIIEKDNNYYVYIGNGNVNYYLKLSIIKYKIPKCLINLKNVLNNMIFLLKNKNVENFIIRFPFIPYNIVLDLIITLNNHFDIRTLNMQHYQIILRDTYYLILDNVSNKHKLINSLIKVLENIDIVNNVSIYELKDKYHVIQKDLIKLFRSNIKKRIELINSNLIV